MALLLEYYEAMVEYTDEDGEVHTCAGFIKDTAAEAREHALEQAALAGHGVRRIAVYRCVRVELEECVE